MDDSSSKLIFLILGVLLSLLSGLCLYLVKQAGAALADVRKAVSELATRAAVADERHAYTQGLIAALGSSQEKITKDIGRLTASVEKMWAAMQNAKLAKRRLSDDLTGTEE
jgi:hypothetical protein